MDISCQKRLISCPVFVDYCNFLLNKSAIQACNNADSVILVEKKGGSSNKDIARMVDMLLICKSNVEGFVLL